MRNIAFEVLIYMEKKQVRLNIGIQKRYIKKGNNAKLDPGRVQKDRQERHQRRMHREEIRRAFMSGWKQGVQYGENLKKDQQGEVDGRKEEIRS